MAKGQIEKQEVINKILSTFDGAFEYEKTIRIPINDVQIKVQLTCAKDNVEPNADNAIPAAVPVQEDQPVSLVQPTQEEIDTVHNLMEKLNL